MTDEEDTDAPLLFRGRTAGESRERTRCCGFMDVKLYNIVLLGLSFMLLFTAFQTCSMVEVCRQRILKFTGGGVFYFCDFYFKEWP